MPKSLARKQILRAKNVKIRIVGIVLLLPTLSFALMGMFSDFPDIDPIKRLEQPSWTYPLGTDFLGRDVFLSSMKGSLYSISTGVISVSFALILGSIMGAISALFSSWIGIIVNSAIDLLLFLPRLVMVMLISFLIGKNNITYVCAISLAFTPIFAKTVIALVNMEKNKAYVEAAITIGLKEYQIFIRHILRNIRGPLVSILPMCLGQAILVEASLSYFGFGSQSLITLGKMLNDSRPYINSNGLLFIVPVLLITSFILGLNIIANDFGNYDFIA